MGHWDYIENGLYTWIIAKNHVIMADFFGFKITTSKKQKVLFDYANTTPDIMIHDATAFGYRRSFFQKPFMFHAQHPLLRMRIPPISRRPGLGR